MFALTGNSDINTSLQERFAGASPGEVSLQDARTLKSLKLRDQHKVQEGLTEVEAERENSAVHQISCGNEKIVLISLACVSSETHLFSKQVKKNFVNIFFMKNHIL